MALSIYHVLAPFIEGMSKCNDIQFRSNHTLNETPSS